jgi:hypothetical protein
MVIRNHRRLLAPLAALILLALPALAMQKHGGQGEPAYDPATETTVRGVIEEVTRPMCPMMAEKKGLHLTVKAGEQSYVVHLGPASFSEKHGFSPQAGAAIEVTGSRVQMEGKESLLARKLVSGPLTLVLRDERGKPAWSGGPHQH